MSISSPKQGLFLSDNVDEIKMAGKKHKMAPMWKNLLKNVDLDEPTSVLDHENLGCTQSECKPNETIIDRKTKMLESHIFCWSNRKIPGWQKPHAQTWNVCTWHELVDLTFFGQ